jgi:alginate O-acetyltransferase complex protein AlgI
MLFNSWPFVLLVLLTLSVYYLPVFRKKQVAILVVASLFFYAYRQPTLLFLLVFNAVLNATISFLVAHQNRANIRKWWAVLGVCCNLSVLFFFKYAGLFHATLQPGDWADFMVDIPLPVGISFYTFQGISLVVDVFRKHETTVTSRSFTQHLLHTVLFIGFFPQLVAGPIVKAKDFMPQIEDKYWSSVVVAPLFKKLVLGYFLKMVIADNLKDFTFWMAFPYFKGFAALDLWTMLFGFSFQIFADFAGYSLIAIGIAGLFGYQLRDNFLFPYTALSFRDFWRRWHISLSGFLHQYLYIPMGGNRKGKLRLYVHLFLTMLIGGLWHGASWGFAVWGAFHGLLLVLERMLNAGDFRSSSRGAHIAKTLLVFTCISLGWLLFKLPHHEAWIYVQHLLTYGSTSSNMVIVLNIVLYSAPVIGYHLYPHVRRRFPAIQKGEVVYLAVMLFLIVSNSGSAVPFIYFQF